MTAALAEQLISTVPDDILEEAAADPVRWLLKQQRFPAGLARAVADCAAVFSKAGGKFGSWHSPSMRYTREGFEQSSGQAAARFKAGLAPSALVADLCAGLGFDSLAFLEAGSRVWCNDRNPALPVLAAHNHKIHGQEASYLNLDATAALAAVPPDALVYLDPARRDQHGRSYAPEHHDPNPLALIRAFPDRRFLIKLSPLADPDTLPTAFGRPFSTYTVSVQGENKEVLALDAGGPPEKTAVIIGGDGRVTRYSGTEPLPPGRELEAGAVLVLPDPALLHARLTGTWARRFALQPVTGTDGLFTGNSFAPGAYCGTVSTTGAWKPEKLGALLKQAGVGGIRFRFSSRLVEHSALRRRIGVPDGGGWSLVVFRSGGHSLKFALCRDEAGSK